jgi:hypothetical protein
MKQMAKQSNRLANILDFYMKMQDDKPVPFHTPIGLNESIGLQECLHSSHLLSYTTNQTNRRRDHNGQSGCEKRKMWEM